MSSSSKLTSFLLLLLFLPIFVSGEFNHTSNAKHAFEVLQKWYNPASGLWDTAGWWNGANCMTTIAGLSASDPSVLGNAGAVFATTYTKASLENPGFIDSCYDDNGWWALAWIAAYDVTNVTKYLTLAEEIFTNMTGGGPSICNHGGIYWCSTSNYVNAIANELYLSVAAHLANRPTSNRDYYLSTAMSQWIWFNSSGMINSENLVNDGLTGNCTNNGYPVWTYNQGGPQRLVPRHGARHRHGRHCESDGREDGPARDGMRTKLRREPNTIQGHFREEFAEAASG